MWALINHNFCAVCVKYFVFQVNALDVRDLPLARIPISGYLKVVEIVECHINAGMSKRLGFSLC